MHAALLLPYALSRAPQLLVTLVLRVVRAALIAKRAELLCLGVADFCNKPPPPFRTWQSHASCGSVSDPLAHLPAVEDQPSPAQTLQPHTSTGSSPAAALCCAQAHASLFSVVLPTTHCCCVVEKPSPWQVLQPHESVQSGCGSLLCNAEAKWPSLSPQVPPRYCKLSKSSFTAHVFRRNPSSTGVLHTFAATISHLKML
mmetsp:Transcript_31003/g.93767  ORF Transcript_31003/g.93767 Transcript_31003/m.93767 type:complete len:200 (-) Transcript_31003:531-1130(-)